MKEVTIRMPDIAGRASKAWRINLADVEKAMPEPRSHSTIGMWVIEAPWAHPIWHSYVVFVMHLRPLSDTPPPKISLKGATHEMHLFALDPDCDRDKYIADAQPQVNRDGKRGLPWLHPGNFGSQIIESSDEAAIKRVSEAVTKVCDGKLSPDTDYIRHWMHLFGDNLIKDPSTAGDTILMAGDGTVIAHHRAHPGPQDKH